MKKFVSSIRKLKVSRSREHSTGGTSETLDDTLSVVHDDIPSSNIPNDIPETQADGHGGVRDLSGLNPPANNDPGLIPNLKAPKPPEVLLEGLPVEIHEFILLELPTLRSLDALVHASPHLHASYAQNRQAILRTCLLRTLEDIAVDAHYCHVSGTDTFQRNRDMDLIWDSFATYQEARASASTLTLIQQLPLEDLIVMARFHTGIIESLAERYAEWALAALSPLSDAAPPSKVETLRIYRALYHLQIFCNLCGHRTDSEHSMIRITDSLDRTQLLSHFPAWRVEEMLCIHKFAMDIYDQIFHQVSCDVNKGCHPGHDNSSVGGKEALELDPEYALYYEHSRNAVLIQGLPLLSTVIGVTDYNKLVELIRDRILAGVELDPNLSIDWISDAVQEGMQDSLSGPLSIEGNVSLVTRQQISFTKDTVESHPLAWVILWKGRYSNLFGAYVPETLRRWGYIIWDAKRLDSGGKQYLLAEWSAVYGFFDPRDNFWSED